MTNKIMELADEYADLRGAEDCGGDPRDTVDARIELLVEVGRIDAELNNKEDQISKLIKENSALSDNLEYYMSLYGSFQ